MGKRGVTRIAKTLEREGLLQTRDMFAEVEAHLDAFLAQMRHVEKERRSVLLAAARHPTTFSGKRAMLTLATRYNLTLPQELAAIPAPMQERIRRRARWT